MNLHIYLPRRIAELLKQEDNMSRLVRDLLVIYFKQKGKL